MLELIDVKKTFNPGTINAKKALCGVDLHLNPGDFVTIIGGNGAGKSTTLNAIAAIPGCINTESKPARLGGYAWRFCFSSG